MGPLYTPFDRFVRVVVTAYQWLCLVAVIVTAVCWWYLLIREALRR